MKHIKEFEEFNQEGINEELNKNYVRTLKELDFKYTDFKSHDNWEKFYKNFTFVITSHNYKNELKFFINTKDVSIKLPFSHFNEDWIINFDSINS